VKQNDQPNGDGSQANKPSGGGAEGRGGSSAPQREQATEHKINPAKQLWHYAIARPIQWLIDWLDGHAGLVTAVATAVIAAFTVSLAIDSARQAGITNKQLSVMQDQLDAMKRAERPWISVEDVKASAPFVISDKGITFTFALTARNVGHAPAMFALLTAKLFVRSPDAHEVFDAWLECAEARKRDVSIARNGTTIFPNQTSPMSMWFRLTRFHVDRLTKEDAATMMLAGCIDYLAPLSAEHHQTAFVYEVDRAGPNGSLLTLRGAEGEIPVSDVRLMINPGLAGNAD
jgi:hypothetical protein